MRVLTPTEITQFKAERIPNGIPVRFMHEGQSVNVITGALDPKGCNIMYQTTYWNFDRKTSLKIATLTGTRATFSEE